MTASVTVSRLDGWRAEQLRSAGRRLLSDAEVLTGAARMVEQLSERARSDRPPEGGWEGRAADAAAASLRAVATSLAAGGEELALAGTVVTRAAGVLGAARALLGRARALATAHGLTLHEDGSVPDPPPVLLPADVPAYETAQVRQRHSAACDAAASARAMAREALAAAAEGDRDAAAALDHLRHLAPPPTSPPAPIGAGRPAPSRSATAPDALLLGGLLQAVTARAVPPPRTEPRRVAAWWDTLPPQERRAALRLHPGELGALDGLPLSVRDQANRRVLAEALRSARTELAALPDALAHQVGGLPPTTQPAATLRMQLLRATVARLEEVARQLADGDPPPRLLLLDPSARAVAVVHGDLDRAEHVAVLVPGMGTRVATSLPALAGAARRLHRTAEDLAVRSSGRRVATVAWIGYPAPRGVLQASSAARARAGAPALRRLLTGIDGRADARGRDVHLTLVGHSYGSMVAGTAVRRRAGVDDLVVLGSPGVGAATRADLHVPGTVYALEARGDPVAELGWFGEDPGDEQFAAVLLESDGGVDPRTGQALLASEGHSAYYDAGSESLRNVAAVVAGRPELATQTGVAADTRADPPLRVPRGG